MDFSKAFTLWILFNYFIAASVYGFGGDWGRALYWIFCIMITFTSIFLIK